MQKKVLTVSSHRDIQRDLGSELSRLGYVVLSAGGFDDCISLCRSASPPLILLDAALLDNGGNDRLFSLRRECPQNEVILLAAEAELGIAVQALDMEAGDIIPLPHQPGELEAGLAAGLERLRIRQKLIALKEKCGLSSSEALETKSSIKERVDHLVDLERLEVAQQVVEGLSTALHNLVGRVEGGEKFLWEFPSFVSLHNRQRKVVAANKLAKLKLGDIVGKDSWEICSKDRPEPEKCPVNLTFDMGESQFSHEMMQDLDGSEIPVMVYTVPIKNQTGEVTLVLALAADMSEVKRYKTELFAMQRRYQQLFDEAPCFISLQDKSLSITAANRRFKEAFGDDLNKPCYELYKGRPEACTVCPVKRTFLYGEPQSSEEVLTGEDGREYAVLTHTAPIRDKQRRHIPRNGDEPGHNPDQGAAKRAGGSPASVPDPVRRGALLYLGAGPRLPTDRNQPSL